MKIPKLVFAFFLLLPLQSYPNYIDKIGMERAEEIINFLDTNPDQFLINIKEMEKKNLKSAKLEVAPWEGYHWPINKGLLAARYGDDSIPRNGTWEFYLEKFNSKPAEEYIKNGKIDLLSPAEKYDLLLGDVNFSFSKKMWAFGKKEMAKYNQINPWAGISHGFALASLNLPNPLNPVKLWSVDKKYLITFSPDDIKALGSMFYSIGAENVRALGARCKEESPTTYNTGRVITEECNDINSGKFHVALINQIGIAQKSFIMDSAYNTPVWNYPVVGYNLEYFNPKRPKIETDFESGIIELKKLEKDPFWQFRNDNTRFLIGVRAHILSTNYRSPWANPIEPKSKIFDYEYDLELDKDLNIIGGEWHSLARPDFIWQPIKGFSPITDFEEDMYDPWEAQWQYLPDFWMEAAIKASNEGIVISQIVKNLFWLSSKGKNGYKTN